MGGAECMQSFALREAERHSALLNGWTDCGGVYGVSKSYTWKVSETNFPETSTRTITNLLWIQV
jgi:hypothetical protein